MAQKIDPLFLDETAKLIDQNLKCVLGLSDMHFDNTSSWNLIPDEDLPSVMARVNSGEIDIVEDLGWMPGDVREVTCTDNTKLEWVLTDPSHYELTNPLPNGKSTCNYVVVLKDRHPTSLAMNSTNTNAGSWESSLMKTQIQPDYVGGIFSTLPEGFKSILQSFKVKTATEYNSSSVTTSTQKIALFAEKEAFGTNTFSTAQEAAALTQLNYFKTSSNRIKTVNGSASAWWLRSPFSSNATTFCLVTTTGSATGASASFTYGVCAFGCI